MRHSTPRGGDARYSLPLDGDDVPARDGRDPALEFTPKVLGPQGFHRSAWTGRYVDEGTEADFVAFSHRSRWGRVPVAFAFLFVIGLGYYFYTLRVSAEERAEGQRVAGLVIFVTALLYGAVGCLLTSATVVDRLGPWWGSLLTARRRALWASTLLAPIAVQDIVVHTILFIDHRVAWVVRIDHPPSLGDGGSNTTANLATSASSEKIELQGRGEGVFMALFALALTTRVCFFAPVAAVTVLAIVAVALVKAGSESGHGDDHAFVANFATVYLVPGLMIAAWEQQQRAHFRARASAAWQAERGRVLARLMYSVVERARYSTLALTLPSAGDDDVARSAAHVGVIAAMSQDAAAPGGLDGRAAVLAFRLRFGAAEASAGQQLTLKAALIASVERVVDAMQLDAVRYGGCGDSVLLAVVGLTADAEGAGDAHVVVLAAVAARQVLRDVEPELSESGASATAGVAPGGVRVVELNEQQDGSEVPPPQLVLGTAGGAARRVAESFGGTWGVVLSGAAAGTPAVQEAFELAPLGSQRRVTFGAHASQGATVSTADSGARCLGLPRTEGAAGLDGRAQRAVSVSRATERDGGDGADDGTADAMSARLREAATEASTTVQEELVAADATDRVGMSWACPYGLAFEEAEVEAAYRASENAAAMRHSVVCASAWVNLVVTVLYLWHGAWHVSAVTASALAVGWGLTAVQWVVLRPMQPGQTRWAVVTVVLYPLQSAALVLALRYFEEPTDPVKLHQRWLVFLVSHVYVVALPTCVPFVAGLFITFPSFFVTSMWAARIDQGAGTQLRALWDPVSLSAALLFYCFLVNAVRYRARLQFADHVLSYRSSARWRRARERFRQRLASVMPLPVATRVVDKLTKRTHTAGAAELVLPRSPGVEGCSGGSTYVSRFAQSAEDGAEEMAEVEVAAESPVHAYTARIALAQAPVLLLDLCGGVVRGTDDAQQQLRAAVSESTGGGAAAHVALWQLLVPHMGGGAGAASGLFVSAYGPAGFLVAGLEPASTSDVAELLELAFTAAESPAIAAFGGLRAGIGRGALAGDLLGRTSSRFEVVGPGVQAAVADARDGVGHLRASADVMSADGWPQPSPTFRE